MSVTFHSTTFNFISFFVATTNLPPTPSTNDTSVNSLWGSKFNLINKWMTFSPLTSALQMLANAQRPVLLPPLSKVIRMLQKNDYISHCHRQLMIVVEPTGRLNKTGAFRRSTICHPSGAAYAHGVAIHTSGHKMHPLAYLIIHYHLPKFLWIFNFDASLFSNPYHTGCLLFTLIQNAKRGNERTMRLFRNLYAMLISSLIITNFMRCYFYMQLASPHIIGIATFLGCKLHPHLVCNATFRWMQYVSADAPPTSPLSSVFPLLCTQPPWEVVFLQWHFCFVPQTNVSEERGNFCFHPKAKKKNGRNEQLIKQSGVVKHSALATVAQNKTKWTERRPRGWLMDRHFT